MRIPRQEVIVFKPGRIPYHQLRPELLLVTEPGGRVLHGSGLLPKDAQTHLRIYRERLDVNSVVHVHSPYATAWALAGVPLRVPMLSMSRLLGHEVPVAPHVEDDSLDAAEVIMTHTQACPVVLIKGHGMYCLAADGNTAMELAVMTEGLAKLLLISEHVTHLAHAVTTLPIS